MNKCSLTTGDEDSEQRRIVMLKTALVRTPTEHHTLTGSLTAPAFLSSKFILHIKLAPQNSLWKITPSTIVNSA